MEPKRKRGRPMKVDNAKVIQEIINLKTKKGFSATGLVEYLKETYDLSSTRVYELIKQAREEMGEVYQKLNEKVLEDAILLLESMRQKALGEGNDKLALEIQKELNKINQLYIQKLDITSGGEKIVWNEVRKYKDE